MKNSFPGFPPEALRFFRQLKRHNDRLWFLEHKEIYEQKVKAPMVELVLALAREMQSFAPEMVVEPKRAIYRIYRDVRFSSDKRPYKTQIAAVFSPRRIPKHAGAGLYFHVAPEEVLIAGGVYMPGSAELLAIRRHILAYHPQLRRILEGRLFKRLFGSLIDDQLTRSPKGFPTDHPAVDLLRYKQFLVSISKPPNLAEGPQLFPQIVQAFQAMMPLLRFLNSPLTPVKIPPGALMGGEITKAVNEVREKGILVISLNMAGSVPEVADLVVSDPVQAGVMAVMAVADTAKFDMSRQRSRRY